MRRGLDVRATRSDMLLCGPVEPQRGGFVVALGDVDGDAHLRIGYDRPWPARDDLWALERASGVLVVGRAERCRSICDRLAQRGVEAFSEDSLTRTALEAADVVIVSGTVDQLPLEPGDPEPLHHLAPAVLAAGRVLIAPRASRTYGFLPGIDHIEYVADDEAAQCADAVVSHPAAFELMRVMGGLHARAHRASDFYSRILTSMELATRP